MRTVAMPFFVFDHYNFLTAEYGGERISFLYDLLDVSSLSKQHGVPFYVVVQQAPHGWTDFMFDKLKPWQNYWLANMPLVFGAKSTVMFGIRQPEPVKNDIFFGDTVFNTDARRMMVSIKSYNGSTENCAHHAST